MSALIALASPQRIKRNRLRWRRGTSSRQHYNYFRDYDASTGRYVQSDPIGLRGGVGTYMYTRNMPLIRNDFFGLYSQYSVGVGGTGGLIVFGVNIGFNFGISVPENWKNWRCYQLFAGPQAASMVGGGIYGGVGVTVGKSESSQPMSPLFGGIYRYMEADLGWEISGSLYQQGSENLSGKDHLWRDDSGDREAWRKDMPSNPSGFSPLPKVGAGYGAWVGGGYIASGGVSTPTVGSDCECSK